MFIYTVLNEIIQFENKTFLVIIIIHDALLSIGASNEEIANQDHHLDHSLQYLLTISLGQIHGNNFCWGIAPSFSVLRAFECRTLQLR